MGPVGPIRTVVAVIAKIFGPLAAKGWVYNSSSLTAASFLFTILSLVFITLLFYVHIVKHNKVSESSEKINTMKDAALYLGGRLFLLPLIVAAPALPLMARTIAMNFSVWSASQSVAMEVAGVGDALLNKIMVLDRYTLHKGNDPTAMSPDMLAKVGLDMAKTHEIRDAKNEAAALVARYQKEVEDAPNPRAKRAAEAALAKVVQSQDLVEGEVDNLVGQARTFLEKKQGQSYNAEMFKRAMNKLLIGYNMEAGTTYNGARGSIVTKDGGHVSDWSKLDPNNIQKVVDERTGNVIVRGEDIARALMEVSRENEEAGKMDTVDAGVAAVKGITELIGSIGFYISIAPAILGIGAGALSTLKAAIGLIQFGAKVSIMINLGLSIATIFSSFFVFLILFQKTEQFAYTFFRFLLSVIIATFGIHFVLNTVGMTVAQSTYGMVATVNMLIVKAGALGKNGSLELFKICCGAGLAAFAVGMMTEFIIDVCKSAGVVAQGSLTGSFNP